MDNAPDIFVRIAAPGLLGERLAKAHIRERIKGAMLFRYLVWRDGPGWPKEFYLGKVAIPNKTTKMGARAFDSRPLKIRGHVLTPGKLALQKNGSTATKAQVLKRLSSIRLRPGAAAGGRGSGRSVG